MKKPKPMPERVRLERLRADRDRPLILREHDGTEYVRADLFPDTKVASALTAYAKALRSPRCGLDVTDAKLDDLNVAILLTPARKR